MENNYYWNSPFSSSSTVNGYVPAAAQNTRAGVGYTMRNDQVPTMGMNQGGTREVLRAPYNAYFNSQPNTATQSWTSSPGGGSMVQNNQVHTGGMNEGGSGQVLRAPYQVYFNSQTNASMQGQMPFAGAGSSMQNNQGRLTEMNASGVGEVARTPYQMSFYPQTNTPMQMPLVTPNTGGTSFQNYQQRTADMTGGVNGEVYRSPYHSFFHPQANTPMQVSLAPPNTAGTVVPKIEEPTMEMNYGGIGDVYRTPYQMTFNPQANYPMQTWMSSPMAGSAMVKVENPATMMNGGGIGDMYRTPYQMTFDPRAYVPMQMSFMQTRPATMMIKSEEPAEMNGGDAGEVQRASDQRSPNPRPSSPMQLSLTPPTSTGNTVEDDDEPAEVKEMKEDSDGKVSSNTSQTSSPSRAKSPERLSNPAPPERYDVNLRFERKPHIDQIIRGDCSKKVQLLVDYLVAIINRAESMDARDNYFVGTALREHVKSIIMQALTGHMSAEEFAHVLEDVVKVRPFDSDFIKFLKTAIPHLSRAFIKGDVLIDHFLPSPGMYREPFVDVPFDICYLSMIWRDYYDLLVRNGEAPPITQQVAIALTHYDILHSDSSESTIKEGLMDMKSIDGSERDGNMSSPDHGQHNSSMDVDDVAEELNKANMTDDHDDDKDDHDSDDSDSDSDDDDDDDDDPTYDPSTDY